MRRLASKQEKALLYVLQDGLCAGPCKRLLDQFEAHHIVAWSEGGPTETCNLQLLCPECHRGKKGSFSDQDS